MTDISRNWYDLSVNSNILKQTYITGFIDVSNNIVGRENLYVLNEQNPNYARLGIGTINPNATIHLRNNVPTISLVNSSANASQNDINLGCLQYNPGNNGSTIQCMNLLDNYNNNGSLIFSTSSSPNNLVLRENGKVGINIDYQDINSTLELQDYIHCYVLYMAERENWSNKRHVINKNSNTLYINNDAEWSKVTVDTNKIYMDKLFANSTTSSGTYLTQVNEDAYYKNNLTVNGRLDLYGEPYSNNTIDKYMTLVTGSNSNVVMQQTGSNNNYKMEFKFTGSSENDCSFKIRSKTTTHFEIAANATYIKNRLYVSNGLNIRGEIVNNLHGYSVSVYCGYQFDRDHRRGDYTLNRYGMYCKGPCVFGDFHIYSDKRIKQNISYMKENESLKILRKLKPCSYKYLSGNKSYGFIAQDVKKIMPHIVHTYDSEIANINMFAEVSGDNYNILTFSKPIIHLLEYNELNILFSKLKMFNYSNNKKIVEISNIISDNVLHVSTNLSDFIYENKIFVYGQYIEGLLNINYNAVWSNNICVIQALHKKIGINKEKISYVEGEIKKRDEQITKMSLLIDDIKTRLKR